MNVGPQLLWLSLSAVGMAVGLAGCILPVLPGLLLIWLTALGYGLVSGFGLAGFVAFGLITALTLAGGLAANLLPHTVSAAAGASRRARVLGILLGVIGFFLVPVVGVLLGVVLGVLLGEYWRRREWRASWRATRGAIVGFGLGALIQATAGAMAVIAWGCWAAANVMGAFSALP